jgi:hypothetical protein
MRDIGLFIWVGILILGVVSSIARSAKRQQQGAQQAPGAQAPAAAPLVPPGSSPQQATLMRVMQAIAAQQGVAQAPPRPVRPVSKPAPPPPPPPRPPEPARHAAQPPPQAKRQRLLFGSQTDLVRAVIAAEVLGKPKAFSDEYPR